MSLRAGDAADLRRVPVSGRMRIYGVEVPTLPKAGQQRSGHAIDRPGRRLAGPPVL
jgi:hypothetical protein